MAFKELSDGEIWRAMIDGMATFSMQANHDDPKRQWWYVRRVLAEETDANDPRVLYLYPQGSGCSLGISSSVTDVGYALVYDFFDRPRDGWRAALSWDGKGEEPLGWNRAHRLGSYTRRRIGGGGPETEYIDEHDLGDDRETRRRLRAQLEAKGIRVRGPGEHPPS